MAHRAITAIISAFAIAAAVFTSPIAFPGAYEAATYTATVEVYFSPRGGCQNAIVKEIAGAKQSIRVQAYSFTNAEIARALRDAHRRGVNVEVILDKSQQTAKYSSATFLHNAGIPVLIDAEHAIAHNKIIILDGATVITGSFNFSRAAEERNAENLLILKGSQGLAALYMANYLSHRKHSHPYVRPADTKGAASANPRETTAGKTHVVYVTEHGKRYHLKDCSALASSRIPLTLSEAKRRGYTPCRLCRPPE